MRMLTKRELSLGAIALAGMAVANTGPDDEHTNQSFGAYGGFRAALNRIFVVAYGFTLGDKVCAEFVSSWEGAVTYTYLADWVAHYIKNRRP